MAHRLLLTKTLALYYRAPELDMILIHGQDQFGTHQAPITKRQDAEPRAPVLWVVLCVVQKRPVRRVGDAAGIDTVAGAAVIGQWRYLGAVQVPSDDGFSGPHRIVVCRVDASFKPMLDDNIVDPHRPAWFPEGKVVSQVNPMNLGELRSDYCKAGLKAGIMITERPDLPRFTRSDLDLMEAILRRLDFLLDGWEGFPADGGMAGDGSGVDNVPVEDNDGGPELFTESNESTMGNRCGTGPVMTVGTDQDGAVVDLKLDAARVLYAGTEGSLVFVGWENFPADPPLERRAPEVNAALANAILERNVSGAAFLKELDERIGVYERLWHL
jgi:hypothetical protein